MKVVVFEDDDGKFLTIKMELEKLGVSDGHVNRLQSLSEFFQTESRTFDLCIIDMFLPMVVGGPTVNASKEIIAAVEQAGGLRVPVLAITAFPDDARSHLAYYSSKGCLVYDYNDKETWTRALGVFLTQAKDRNRYDFIIFCALEEERDAYLRIGGFKPNSVTRSGLDFWDFDWAGKRGAIVLCQRTGLVPASITTARVLENYAPSVVCMSGICGGFKGSELGQLLITELCWEYQSGKWFEDQFQNEPYQVEISDKLRIVIAKDLEDKQIVRKLEDDSSFEFRPTKISQPKLAIFATGSAVIASKKRLDSVKTQHRKVLGIDMEIYGFHRAVKMCNEDIKHFSAKTVVDKADEAKSDQLHSYGAYISAKYCLRLIQKIIK